MSKIDEKAEVRAKIKEQKIKVADAKDVVKLAEDASKQSKETLANNSAELCAVERANADGIAAIELLKRQLSAEERLQESIKERREEIQIQVDEGREHAAADEQKVATEKEKLAEETGYLSSYKKKMKGLRKNVGYPICDIICILFVFLPLPIASFVIGAKYYDPELYIPKMLMIHGALLTGSIVLSLIGFLLIFISEEYVQNRLLSCLINIVSFIFAFPGTMLLVMRPILEPLMFIMIISDYYFGLEMKQNEYDPEMYQLHKFCNTWKTINIIKMILYGLLCCCGLAARADENK